MIKWVHSCTEFGSEVLRDVYYAILLSTERYHIRLWGVLLERVCCILNAGTDWEHHGSEGHGSSMANQVVPVKL
jgi:hypothetical protein